MFSFLSFPVSDHLKVIEMCRSSAGRPSLLTLNILKSPCNSLFLFPPSGSTHPGNREVWGTWRSPWSQTCPSPSPETTACWRRMKASPTGQLRLPSGCRSPSNDLRIWSFHLIFGGSQGSVCDRRQGHFEADHNQRPARGSFCGRDPASGSGLPAHWQTRRRWEAHLNIKHKNKPF